MQLLLLLPETVVLVLHQQLQAQVLHGVVVVVAVVQEPL
jgi:hypothetical protein